MHEHDFSAMKVTIHRGSREIGGSCVEVCTPGSRLILDAGASLAASAEERLPEVTGFSCAGEKVDAVLLSHAHGDHTGLLHLAQAEVPVWMTRGTRLLLLAGEWFARWHPIGERPTRILRPGVPECVGDCTVTALSVDHSAFDSVAFLIECGGRRLLYSGDIRLHGRKPGMARTLIRAAARGPLDALLLEGTHFSRPDAAAPKTEAALTREIARELRGAPALALAFVSPQHLDRMVAFYKAARATGRTFALDLYGAYLWSEMRRQLGGSLPAIGAKNGLRVYFPSHIPRRVPKSLSEIFRPHQVTLDEMRTSPGDFLLLSRPSMVKLDFKHALPPRTLGIYSMWSGYLSRADWQATLAALEKCGGHFAEHHTSGHAPVADLAKLVTDLRPRRVVPIHTEHPEAFREHFPQTEIHNDGETFHV